MKKLICRELYLARKNMLLSYGIGLIFFITGILVLLSCRFGNVARYNTPEEVESMMSMLAFCMPVMIYSMALVTGVDAVPAQIFADHLCGWHKFIKSSELKPGDYVGAKYLTILLLFAVATVMMFICCPVFFVLGGISKLNLTVYVAILDFVMMYADLSIPLNLWAKKRERTTFISIIPLCVMSVAGVMGGAYLADRPELANEIIRLYENGSFGMLAYIILGVLAVLMYFSYRLSVYFVEVEG